MKKIELDTISANKVKDIIIEEEKHVLEKTKVMKEMKKEADIIL